jgi:hypothetical protein
MGRTSIGEKVSMSQTVHVINDGRILLRPNLRKNTHATIKNGRLINRNTSIEKKVDTRRTINALIQRIRALCVIFVAARKGLPDLRAPNKTCFQAGINQIQTEATGGSCARRRYVARTRFVAARRASRPRFPPQRDLHRARREWFHLSALQRRSTLHSERYQASQSWRS